MTAHKKISIINALPEIRETNDYILMEIRGSLGLCLIPSSHFHPFLVS